MNRKEISMIRNRFKPDKISINVIRGCYVNENKEVVSSFECSPAALPQEELDKYLAIFRRALSGQPGKNLLEMHFSPDQVMESEQYAHLSSLRDTALRSDDVVEAFFQKVIDSADIEGNYVILLTRDVYDIPFHSRDDLRQDELSDEVFSYIVCCICPVKLTPEGLCYDITDNAFHENVPDWIVAGPEIGFMFPAFEDNGANIYTAMYYSKDAGSLHDDLIDALFGCDAPMDAPTQRDTFSALLEETVGEELSLDVMQNVTEALTHQIDLQKSDRELAAPVMNKAEMREVLRASGVQDESIATFDRRYDEDFGLSFDLNCKNIVDTGKFELRTPDVVINVSPERRDLVETRVIDGQKWIMIRAEEGVTVNGINIHIGE